MWCQAVCFLFLSCKLQRALSQECNIFPVCSFLNQGEPFWFFDLLYLNSFKFCLVCYMKTTFLWCFVCCWKRDMLVISCVRLGTDDFWTHKIDSAGNLRTFNHSDVYFWYYIDPTLWILSVWAQNFQYYVVVFFKCFFFSFSKWCCWQTRAIGATSSLWNVSNVIKDVLWIKF